MHFNQIIPFILENRELFVTFIVTLVAIIKLTAWGKAQAAALDSVIGVIERLGASDVKREVSTAKKQLSGAVKDAILDSVAKADPKKTPKNLLVRILREVFRRL